MSFSLTILGSSSALPKPNRYTTAHVLNAHERFFLIDCGEGTQLQLRRFRIPFSRIHHIFISHLHGDHFFGLPGLISSFNLMGRKKALHVFGPSELETIVLGMHQVMGENLNYPLIFYRVNPYKNEILLDTPKLLVESIPLNHKKPCAGFLFREKQQERHMIPANIEEYDLGISEIVRLKQGEDVIREDGSILLSNQLTADPPQPRSYAFVSDTRYHEAILPLIRQVSLLYHEATYLHAMKDRADKTGHSTAKEAGRMAHLAGVGQLIIGHFSARYKSTDPLVAEAREIFENTLAAEDGLCIDVKNLP